MLFVDEFTQKKYEYDITLHCEHKITITSDESLPERRIAEIQKNEGGMVCTICNKKQKISSVIEVFNLHIRRKLINMEYIDGKG